MIKEDIKDVSITTVSQTAYPARVNSNICRDISHEKSELKQAGFQADKSKPESQISGILDSPFFDN